MFPHRAADLSRSSSLEKCKANLSKTHPGLHSTSKDCEGSRSWEWNCQRPDREWTHLELDPDVVPGLGAHVPHPVEAWQILVCTKRQIAPNIGRRGNLGAKMFNPFDVTLTGRKSPSLERRMRSSFSFSSPMTMMTLSFPPSTVHCMHHLRTLMLNPWCWPCASVTNITLARLEDRTKEKLRQLPHRRSVLPSVSANST